MEEPTRRWLYHFSAPALLLIIAGRQLHLSHNANLPPWKGGGFGMFASLDRNENRLLRCYLITNDGASPVQVPPSHDALVDQIRSLPTVDRLTSLVIVIAQTKWVR